MMTYDETTGTLFSADAFGTFGSLHGAIFADEVDFNGDYMSEARRYYTNIVGKYGTQVQSVLKKASALNIKMICPLHGFVWRSNIGDYVDKYAKWSSYTPEEKGVLIAYASVYGNTANVADVLASKLRSSGVKVKVYDVSVTPSSVIVAESFRYSHIVFASTTYNAGIFISMEDLLRDLAAHNIQNRKVALIENGSWAPTSGKLMRGILEQCKNIEFISDTITVKSSPDAAQEEQIETLANAIAADFAPPAPQPDQPSGIDNTAFFKLSYGLFVLTACDNGKHAGCIINTAQLLTDTPKRITISVNKLNNTHNVIMKTGTFNVSVLTESVPFDTIKHFGFRSGASSDKFDGGEQTATSANGIRYLTEHVNAFISAKVITTLDCGTHTLFTAEVTESKTLSQEMSITYDYYFKHVKPKPQPEEKKKKGFVCKICGYVYEGDTLPADFICPICKHGAEDFEPLQ